MCNCLIWVFNGFSALALVEWITTPAGGRVREGHSSSQPGRKLPFGCLNFRADPPRVAPGFRCNLSC